MRCLTRLLCVSALLVSVAFAESLSETRKKAEQGDALAQYNLGGMYFGGSDLPKDPTEAVKWFRKSAEQGNADAQFELGLMYENGNGVPKDPTEAVKWFRKSAEQGSASAQCNLGWVYEKGEGVPKDPVLAHVWYNIAGANGYELAKEFLVRIEKGMSSEQKAEATTRARELFERLAKK